jgi:general secretion pathway protein K
MTNPLRNNNGVALLLAVVITGIIVAVGLHFNVSMREDLVASSRTGKGVKAGVIARSGVNIALAALYEDGKQGETDTLKDPWAKAQAVALYSGSLFDEGRCELVISDHCGRINLNRLIDQTGKPDPKQRAVLERFLNHKAFAADNQSVSDLLDALTDWLDEDDQITGFGAENSYYLSLAEPYECKNGPMDSIDELLLVRGMTKEFYYGTSERPGISVFISIHGDGRININTAPQEVLYALSDQMDYEAAERMARYRTLEGNDLSEINWYKNVSGMSHVALDAAFIKLGSDSFEVISSGSVEKFRKTITASVRRIEKKVPVIISFRVVDSDGVLKNLAP